MINGAFQRASSRWKFTSLIDRETYSVNSRYYFALRPTCHAYYSQLITLSVSLKIHLIIEAQSNCDRASKRIKLKKLLKYSKKCLRKETKKYAKRAENVAVALQSR